MKLAFKLNSFERAVGFFLTGAVGVFILVVLTLAVKQAWFQNSHIYSVSYEEGDGLHVGTPVLVAGLKAGSIQSVEIGDDNKILVTLAVKTKFAERIRTDSTAIITRPFVIGEKQINITLGSKSLPLVPPHGRIQGESSAEITDLLSGKNLKPYLATLESLFGYMKDFVEELNKTDQKFDVVGIYKEIIPTLKSAQEAFHRVPDLQRDFSAIRKDFFFTPEMKVFMSHAGKLSQDLSRLSAALAEVSPEMQGTIRDFAKATPELGSISTQTTQTLGEMLIVLKAIQKSWFLNSHVDDVRKEMEKRSPASK